MALLAVVSVGLVIAEDRLILTPEQTAVLSWTDSLIWLIFSVDYAVGIWASEARWDYFKSHLIELVAILPFNSLLKGLRVLRLLRLTRAARLIRLLRLVRLVAYGGRMAWMFRRFFATHNFYLSVIFTGMFILLGSVAVTHFEGMSFGDALWWAFVTATTVGYGDLSPATTEGRIVAAFLMITGIGFIGFLTGTVATFFLTPAPDVSRKINPHIELVIRQLQDFDSLSEEEVREIGRVLVALRKGYAGIESSETQGVDTGGELYEEVAISGVAGGRVVRGGIRGTGFYDHDPGYDH
jgi:voltage-gated potassium channel